MDAARWRESSRARLVADVKAVVADADAYLCASVGQTGEAYATARKQLERTLDAAKAQIAEAQRAVVDRTRAAASATDGYVHENPWQSIAVGAGVGLVLGIWLARR